MIWTVGYLLLLTCSVVWVAALDPWSTLAQALYWVVGLSVPPMAWIFSTPRKVKLPKARVVTKK